MSPRRKVTPTGFALNSHRLNGQEAAYYTTAGNLTGTIPSTVLANSTVYIGTTGITLNRASGAQALTGITSIDGTATNVTGIVAMANGGTGLASAGTAGNLIRSTGTGWESWTPNYLTANQSITLTGDVTGTGTTSITTTIAANSVALTTDTTGNYVANNTQGSGIGITGTPGEAWSPTIALGNLTANWSQTGAFDIILANAASELRIMESTGATHYGTIDVGDLSANQTYTFTTGGTIYTSGNDPYDTETEVDAAIANNGYITSADDTVSPTELDTTFTTTGILTRTGAATYTTIADNSANWNTAYGWGNHASAGYLSASAFTDGAVTVKLLTGFTAGTNTAITATDTILQAFQKTQGQINARQTTLTNSAGLANALNDETGTGLAVFATSPTLTTPNIGVATATSLNGLTLTSAADGFTLTGGTIPRTLTVIGGNASISGTHTGTSSGTNTGDQTTITGNAGSATYASAVTLTADSTTNATNYPLFTNAATGNLSPRTDTGFTYNPSTGILTATGFSGSGASLTNLTAGNLSGTIPSTVLANSTVYIGTTGITLNRASGAQALTGITSIDGSAATLTTTRTLWGQNFNGSANVTGDLTSVGNITGSSAITMTAGGTNQNITLTPSGTGYTAFSSNVSLATSSYINYGTTMGETGYGFRDNAGIMEYKDTAGTWKTLNSSSGMAIGNSVTSATPGSVFFADTSGNLAQDNANFFWDNGNKRLGIATNSPIGRFNILPIGNLNGNVLGVVDYYNSAINIGNYNGTTGTSLVFDNDQIELATNGSERLHINYNSSADVDIVNGGGKVVIGAGIANITKVNIGGQIYQDVGGNYDVWIQGGATTTGGDNRNLAILGTSEAYGDILYINYTGEYAGGLNVGGVYGNTTAAAANVVIGTTGMLMRSTSSARYKDDIQYDIDGDLLYGLKPASYKDKNSGKEYIGFVAEDVALVEPRLVEFDEEGRPDALHYGNFASLITKTVQDQKLLIDVNTNDLTTKATATSLTDLQNMTDAQFAQTGEILKQFQDDMLALQEDVNAQSNILTDLQINIDSLQAGVSMLTTLGATDALKFADLLAINPDKIIVANDDGDVTVEGIMMAQKIIAQEVQTGVLSIDDQKVIKNDSEEEVNASSIGTAVIPAGETEIEIETVAVQDGSRVFISPKQPLDQTVAATDIVDSKSFRVKLLKANEEDLEIDWMIIGGKVE